MARKGTSTLFGKKPKGALGIVGVILVALLLLAGKWLGIPLDIGQQGAETKTNDTQATVLPEGTYTVERCVDGDTLLLEGGVRIRLIGANTPETVKPNTPVEPFGPEASQFTKKIVADNHDKVRITYDGDKIDRYGRTLAMVWLGDTLLNELLIQKGLAKAELQYNYSRAMKTQFQSAENDAKRAQLGIWSQP